MFMNDTTSTMLERALTIRTEKHAKLADAVANIDTPGYRPEDIDFLETLHAASTHRLGDAMGSEMIITRGEESAPTADGNTVDLDRTMAALAENGTHYTATVKIAQKRMAMMRYVASDGMG